MTSTRKPDHCNISENAASNNYYGIYQSYSSNTTLLNNTASSNDNNNVRLRDSINNTLSNNTANLSGDHGVVLTSSCNYNTLPNNTANPNDEYGIRLYSSSGNEITNNNASSNEWDIHIRSSDSTFTDKTLNGTTISFTYGGDVSLSGDGLYTFRVKAKDNGEPGVDVDYFDIKIWNGTDTEADPVHKAKNMIAGGTYPGPHEVARKWTLVLPRWRGSTLWLARLRENSPRTFVFRADVTFGESMTSGGGGLSEAHEMRTKRARHDVFIVPSLQRSA